MRKVVSGFACSLDGYIQGPKGEIDWILIDKEIDFAEHMRRFDVFLYGRKTYESILKMGAQNLSGATHYIISNTLTSVAPGYALMQGDVSNNILKLKQQTGKDIAVFGGANLLAFLLNCELVDELSISFIPVLLGEGKPMVDVLNSHVWLELKDSRTFKNGTVQLTYTIKRNGG